MVARGMVDRRMVVGVWLPGGGRSADCRRGVKHVFPGYPGGPDPLLQVHDPVRQMDGNVYFACTDFHPVGEENRVYDIDFWLRPVNGELTVFRTKVHKEPRQSLFGWYKHPRYTFVGDDIEYLYGSD